MADYDTMEAGRKLDALVAENVMGYIADPGLPDETGFWYPPELDDEIGDWPSKHGYQVDDAFHYVPRFSTDYAHAFEVVEHMIATYGNDRANGFMITRQFEGDGPPWYVEFPLPVWEYAEADTLPLAICLAALKAVESEP